MITLEHDQLVFRFPEVHEDAECAINFQRTLRIPDSSKDYPLPPGLGEFPLRHLDDYEGRVPKEWQRRGGVMMPMHQSEAMWISFKSYRGEDSYPFAIKIATGKVNAVSGERWTDHLNRDPQDYVVTPDQPWLDGYCVEKGIVRQFIGMPLGKGYSVEEQLTGSAEWGGLQIIVYPLKAEKYLEHLERLNERLNRYMKSMESACYAMSEPSMSLAPGGRMRQKIFEDNFDLGDWDQRHASRCFVTIVNSVAWSSITGERPTNQPPTSTDYTRAKLPWFEYYGGDGEALDGAEALVKANSVAKMEIEKGDHVLPENEGCDPYPVVRLGKGKQFRPVREP